jgi:hypothetical protein
LRERERERERERDYPEHTSLAGAGTPVGKSLHKGINIEKK